MHRIITLTLLLAASASASDQWIMHRVDPDPHSNRYCGFNSLSEGDFNKDGFTDYIVIHEFGIFVGISLLLHPGTTDVPLMDYWEKIEILETTTNEHAQVGDFDADGNLDLVSVEGSERDAPSQIRLVWGPGPDGLRKQENWKYSESFASLDAVGNPHYSLVKDIDLDGDPDILIGGRANPKNGSLIGLRWIENPGEDARDISAWKIHSIDADLWSGHGFDLVDLDLDGDLDVIVNSADFDTPKEARAIIWYENPGKDSMSQPWPKHVIDTDPEYFYKVKVAAGDLDGDGLVDLVCPIADDRIAFFKRKSKKTTDFEKIIIPKQGAAVQLQRHVAVVDMNNDGKMDLLCGALHYFQRKKSYGYDFRNGYIAPDRLVLFWLENDGSVEDAANWKTHPIKMSYGFNGTEWRGEKIDNVLAKDMDGDGDLDVIANSEETFINLEGNSNDWNLRQKSKAIHTFFGIAWFENTETTIIASDSFESGSVQGGEGWDGEWHLSGDVALTEEAIEGSESLLIKGGGNALRTLETPVHEGQLELRWKTRSMDDPSEVCTIEVFDGVWHTLRTFFDDEEEEPLPYRNEMLALSKYDGVSKIRFSNKATGEDDHFIIDEIILKKKAE